MIIEYIKDPIWANKDKTMISCTIKFKEFNEELPFGASADDVVAHGREAFQRLVAGEFGAIADFPEPVVTSSSTGPSIQNLAGHHQVLSSTPESVTTGGNINEEYLKSLIYQVIEEIKESSP